MNNKLLILVGISGSGKSTYAKQSCKKDNSFLRINRDDIRKTLVGDLDNYYQRPDLNSIEREISQIETYMFLKIMNLNKSVIIDNTNLTNKYINRWLELAKDFNLEIKFKFFDCNLLEAKNRVAIRDNYPLSLDENHITTCKYVDYIDKQFEQYNQIKKEYESKNII